MRIIYLSILLIFATIANAQLTRWEYILSGTSEGNAIVSDNNGNIYIGGAFEYTIDCDPGTNNFNLTSNGYFDALIAKYDSSGNFRWAKTIGAIDDDRIIGIALDKQNNVYVLGYFQEEVDFNPGTDELKLTASGPSDIFLLKLDKDGNFVWVKQFADDFVTTNATVYNCALTIDNLNNIYIAGSFMGTVDFDPSPNKFELTAEGFHDAVLLKLNADGVFIWAKKIGNNSGNSTQGLAVKTDKINDVYLLGSFQGTIDVDPDDNIIELTSAVANTPEGYIAKFTSDGDLTWAEQLGANAVSLAIDTTNNIYIAGNHFGTVDLDPSSNIYNLTSKYYTNVFITKLKTDGSFAWAKQFIGDREAQSHFRSISVDYNSNVYTTGFFAGSIDFDPGSEVKNSIKTPSFLSTLDSSGNFIDVLGIDGDVAYTSLNPLQNKINIVGKNSYRIFISGYETLTNASNPQVEEEEEISIYPNPSQNTIHLQADSINEFYIYNNTGTIVLSNQLDTTINSIDISGLQNGIYSYQLKNNGNLIGKGILVIQK